jgi:hypothetical protein
VTEKAAKGNGPAGEGKTDDTGISGIAEGVVTWRDEVLTFFVNVVSSSTNLRLLPGWATSGGDIVANLGRDGVPMVYDSCS